MSTSASAPTHRLSPLRLLVAAVVVLCVVAGTVLGAHQLVQATPGTGPLGWSAGYVDVTATPRYAFENPARNADRDVVLGFVVAAPADGKGPGSGKDSTASCTPSWGGVATLKQAATSLDLDRRIVRLRQRGGDVAVSFGGLRNTELAAACTSAADLRAAYQSVLTRYKATTIDLDIEGASLADPAATARRATAIAALQHSTVAAGGKLAVWLTLPVSTAGLTDEGFSVVQAMLSAGVDLAGVNAMTMDFGASRPAGTSELSTVTSALGETHRQLQAAYRRAGKPISSDEAWAKTGVTPMIGHNDTRGEVLDLAAARAVGAFAAKHHLGRVSMWSLNRDAACSPDATSWVSDNCSGVAQQPGAFVVALSTLPGRMGPNAGRVTVLQTAAGAADDPATSPYPIWNSAGAYRKGSKIVWHHAVYEAKWWAEGDEPDAPVVHPWQTPWQLVGPVLPGEHPILPPALPQHSHPTWSATKTYHAGDIVLYRSRGFRAKWWSQGTAPTFDPGFSSDSPWEPAS